MMIVLGGAAREIFVDTLFVVNRHTAKLHHKAFVGVVKLTRLFLGHSW